MNKKRKGKTERQKAVDRADRYFSLYIRERDRRCVVCNTTELLTCGHLITRSFYATRWDPMNAFGQCKGCNFRHEHDPHPFTAYFLRRYGEEVYLELQRKSHEPYKITTPGLRELGDYWKAEWEKLKQENEDYV